MQIVPAMSQSYKSILELVSAFKYKSDSIWKCPYYENDLSYSV